MSILSMSLITDPPLDLAYMKHAFPYNNIDERVICTDK